MAGKFHSRKSMWSLKVSQGATGEAEQQQSHQQRAPAMLHSWPDDPTLSQLGCYSPREFGNDWWRWLCCPFTHGMTPENRDLQCLTTLAPWLDIGSLWCIQVPTPFGLESIGAAFLSMAPWPLAQSHLSSWVAPLYGHGGYGPRP